MLLRKKTLLGNLLAILTLSCALCTGALAANCTSSISAPCAIATPGSYTFTASVTGVANTDAIPVTANDVTVNMGGWKLTGGSGTGQGLDACSVSCVTNTTVTNGHVISSGSHGLDLGGNVGDIEDVQAIGNGGYGLYLANQSIVYHTVTTSDTTFGILGEEYNVIERNTASANSGGGIEALTGGVVAENAASSNTLNYGLVMSTETGYSRNVTGANYYSGCNGGGSMGQNLCN